MIQPRGAEKAETARRFSASVSADSAPRRLRESDWLKYSYTSNTNKALRAATGTSAYYWPVSAIRLGRLTIR